MKKRIQLTKIDVFLLIFLIVSLALIRFFEATLFYDPFLSFFKTEFHDKFLPSYNETKLYFNLVLRYLLNSGITIAIVYILFKDVVKVKITTFLLTIFGVVLLGAFFIGVNFQFDYMVLFYIRRFLIQPLFLLLFVPAFFYQKLTNSKE